MPAVEENTRFIINSILTNKGWDLDPLSKNKNVYFEKDVLNVINGDTYEKLKTSGKSPDYVLFDTEKNKPIAVIEAKAGGKNLEKALDQGNEYAEILDAPLIFAMNNSYCQTRHLKIQKPLYINEQEVNELIRIKEALKFIDKKSNEIYTIGKEILLSRQELITMFKNINDSLRSEGLSAGIERLTEFAKILFLKLYTENDKETIWSNLKNTPSDFLIDMVNSSLRNIQTEYKTDIFSNIKIKKPDTIREMITRLDKLKLSSMDTDIKGDAFEYFLKSSTATSNDLDEYFTPRHIVKAIINLINPRFNEKIYDPFCGTGGFLTEAFNHIKDNTIIETSEDKTKLTHNTIFGREITNNARLAKMNMILHGDGRHNGIEQLDSLDNPLKNQYDVIATNMPFSQKIVKEIYDPETKKTIKKTLYSHLYQNGLAKNNGDVVCMIHCFEALKDGGRMALIVPEGVLFKQELKNVRKFLMDNCKLQSVISLPQGIFLPYTGVKTDILYFTNCKKQSTDKVWFFDVKNDGFTLDNHRKKIKDNDLKKIDYIDFRKQDFEELKNLGFIQVDYEDIKKNDYNLSVNKYKKEEKICSKWEMAELGEVCEFVGKGKRPASFNNNNNGKFKFIVSSLNEKYCDIADYDFESLIIGDGGCANVHYVNGEFSASDHTYILKQNKNNVMLKYIYYYIGNNLHIIEDGFTGSGLKNISKSYLQNIKISLPPLEIQEKIIQEIEEYEKIMNGCKQVIENWKPKFEIKNEWEKVELGDVCEKITSSNRIFEKEYTNSGIPFFRTKEIVELSNNKIITTELFISEERYSQIKELPKENDILISAVGTIGKVWIVDKRKFYFKDGNLLRLQNLNEIIINSKFLKFILYSYFEKINKLATGGAYNALTIIKLKTIQIPLPPLEEQQEIVTKIEEEQKYIDGCKKMIELYQEKVKKVIDGVVENGE